MAVSALQALRVLDIRGCGVRLTEGRLIARMYQGGPIPADLAAVIRNNKPMLLDHLVEQKRLGETLANALALDDAEFADWCQEINLAPVGDPNLAHDREARWQALAAKRAAEIILEEVA